MGNLAISLGSLIVGVVATIWVSRYYYKRSTNKALTPYLQFFSSLFDGVDPSVRESLKIAYKGTAVTELLEAQFLIANSGATNPGRHRSANANTPRQLLCARRINTSCFACWKGGKHSSIAFFSCVRLSFAKYRRLLHCEVTTPGQSQFERLQIHYYGRRPSPSTQCGANAR